MRKNKQAPRTGEQELARVGDAIGAILSVFWVGMFSVFFFLKSIFEWIKYKEIYGGR